MSNQGDKLDRAVQDALCDMTVGTPRPGLRGRVLARIEGVPILDKEPRWWIGGRLGWAVIGYSLAALSVLGVVAALVAPPWLRQEQRTPLIAHEFSGTSSASSLADSTTMPETEGRRPSPDEVRDDMRLAPHAARPVLSPWRPSPADDANTESSLVVIAPLGYPTPIAVTPIELAPLDIRPVTSTEIHIPLLENNRPKGPGQFY